MQCSNGRSFSGLLSEVNRRAVSSKLALDIFLCGRSRTSGSSLVCLTFTLVRAILLQAESLNNCSSFQIQLSISHFYLQALNSWLSNFHWKSARFHEPQYGRISMDYKPLPAFRFLFENWLKSQLWRHRSSLESRSKPLETESLAEVQFVIDSCRFVSQSNYLNNSNKDCDWLILACFITEQSTADATFTRLENKVWFENSAECARGWHIMLLKSSIMLFGTAPRTDYYAPNYARL